MNFFEGKNVKITKQTHSFKDYAGSYNVETLNSLNHELQLNDADSAIKKKLIKALPELGGFKFVATLVIVLKTMEIEDKIKYDTFYSHQKAETIINESDIADNVFKSIYTTVISKIQNVLEKVSGKINDSVTEHNIYISRYDPLAGSIYIKLPKE